MNTNESTKSEHVSTIFLSDGQVIISTDWSLREFEAITECCNEGIFIEFYKDDEVIDGTKINRIALSIFDYILGCRSHKTLPRNGALRILTKHFSNEWKVLRKLL